MITNQELTTDGKGNFRLRNTFSALPALEEVRRTNELNPGGRFGDKNHEMVCLGHIPNEMWQYDIYLVASKEASMMGDPASAQEYLLKFYDNHPEFRVDYVKKFF